MCLPRNALEDRTFTMYSKELVLILNVPPISIVVNNSYSGDLCDSLIAGA